MWLCGRLKRLLVIASLVCNLFVRTSDCIRMMPENDLMICFFPFIPPFRAMAYIFLSISVMNSVVIVAVLVVRSLKNADML